MKCGIYVCHCGRNIAGTVDVAGVAEFARSLPHVAIVRDYRYLCSDPGQKLIRDDILEHKLDRVIIAACSPAMHQVTFMDNVRKVGLNPYCLERANIREQCSWVHPDNNLATAKAELLVAAAAANILRSVPMVAKEIPVIPEALVVGGGIAGIQAALDLTDAGFKVFLLEKTGHLGGHMARLHQSFPTMENAADLLAKKLAQVEHHQNIEILTGSELTGFEGYIGNFKVKIKKDENEHELSVGVVIVATGFEVFDARLKPEYGYGIYPNVITGLELETLCQSGKIEVNGRQPQNIVFIQCVGSRDKSVGVPYCSRVCCMSTAKQALYLKNKVPGVRVTVCYIDMRAFGKGYEEFYERAQGEGVIYRRGVASEVYQKGGKLVVRGEDTLLGELYEESADLVVLAVGLRPGVDAINLSRMLNVPLDADGFFLELHPKLGPVETVVEGIYVAGCCQGPKDITDAVVQGHAAAVKASIPLLLGSVKKPPLVASIDQQICSGCRLCESSCEYFALIFDDRRKIMTVNEALCWGCGACCAGCPSGANQLKNYSKKQIFDMISVLV